MKRVRLESIERYDDSNNEQNDNDSKTTTQTTATTAPIRAKNSNHASDYHNKMISQHLDWSDKQRRILTSCGNADLYYTTERGYPFEFNELPHFYLQRQLNSSTTQQLENNVTSNDYNSTFEAFQKWKEETDDTIKKNDKELGGGSTDSDLPIKGIWKRPLFIGNFEHTTGQNDEIVYNIQSNTLFIDLRVPVYTRKYLFNNTSNRIQSIDDMTTDQLRYYSRQHIFAGFTKYFKTNHHHSNNNETENFIVSYINNWSNHDDQSSANNYYKYKRYTQYCTRHHCIDWNFIGIGRTRPNKWWVELLTSPVETEKKITIDCWKEYSYSTDEYGQYYYMERWERLLESDPVPNKHDNINLVLRMKPNNDIDCDGIVILINNHFNYCIWNGMKQLIHEKQNHNIYKAIASKVQLIDTALEHNDIITAKKWLRCIQGGHGYRFFREDASNSLLRLTEQKSINEKNGWILDTCIEFWREGTRLWADDEIRITSHSSNDGTTASTAVQDCIILWNNIEWSIFDSQNIHSVEHLNQIIFCR